MMNFVYRFRRHIFVLFILELLSGAFFLAAPFLSKYIIDNAFLKKDAHAFIRLFLAGGAVFIFSALVKLWGEFCRNKIAVNVRLKLAGGF